MIIKNRFTHETILEIETLRNADLSEANLRNADLSWANLSGANLSEANLRGAYLSGANLSEADLSGANLRNADLSEADLSGANLRNTNLSMADLSGADLSGADLSGADLPDFQIVPQEGSFIAWKKGANDCLMKLQIPAKAKRTSTLVGRKCRAEFVKVLSVSGRDGNNIDSCSNWNVDYPITYKVGEIIKADNYNDDIRIECTGGIHFFITKKEAEEW